MDKTFSVGPQLVSQTVGKQTNKQTYRQTDRHTHSNAKMLLLELQGLPCTHAVRCSVAKAKNPSMIAPVTQGLYCTAAAVSH